MSNYKVEFELLIYDLLSDEKSILKPITETFNLIRGKYLKDCMSLAIQEKDIVICTPSSNEKSHHYHTYKFIKAFSSDNLPEQFNIPAIEVFSQDDKEKLKESSDHFVERIIHLGKHDFTKEFNANSSTQFNGLEHEFSIIISDCTKSEKIKIETCIHMS
ncbi:hypothetical protein MASR1M68_14160 [Elusimicrobiota bacterium]